MQPQPFKEQNLLLGSGNNPNTEDMPVAVSRHSEIGGGKIPNSVSNWKLTPEELAKVNETGEIWLSTMGWPPPPITAMAFNPFTVHGYESLEPSQIV